VFELNLSNVHIDKHLSDIFPIQNGLKQKDALSPLPFNFVLAYGFMKLQKNREGLELNGTHLLLVYAYYINLLGRENTEGVLDAVKEICLEVNAEITIYVHVPSPDCRTKSQYKCS
jgi:hypothetical protein